MRFMCLDLAMFLPLTGEISLLPTENCMTRKDGNYKRTVIACFIQTVYLLELDRQENRTTENALAPKWWIPCKYKLVETLIDERDGSIFGAILEWDRAAALTDFVLIRPSGAPRAVLALRGTLLKSPTIRRDIEDDLRFLAWESLKGSVRFSRALKALKSISEKYGSSNICISGHSLGAGFALQVGKALAKEGIFVEAHLFNPPSVSLVSSLRNIGEKAGIMWNRVKSIISSSTEIQTNGDDGSKSVTLGSKQWIPHLYVNNSDYICCYYADPDGKEDSSAEKENTKPRNESCAAKLFVLSKGKQKFLEAHGLEQWWSDDLEMQTALNNSKLISRQLKSLYSLPPPERSPSKA
ncbi:GDSL esterase/lipase At4g10955-like isoform X2 [Primulina eburnea]|uniref:GDSL esterase/lipase At4g10955-like isoform X2 n=1 Tax=Primulina eburnea TaxID=1245227 RepID=UPI003C6C2D34